MELEVLGENMSTFMDISLYTTHPFQPYIPATP